MTKLQVYCAHPKKKSEGADGIDYIVTCLVCGGRLFSWSLKEPMEEKVIGHVEIPNA